MKRSPERKRRRRTRGVKPGVCWAVASFLATFFLALWLLPAFGAAAGASPSPLLLPGASPPRHRAASPFRLQSRHDSERPGGTATPLVSARVGGLLTKLAATWATKLRHLVASAVNQKKTPAERLETFERVEAALDAVTSSHLQETGLLQSEFAPQAIAAAAAHSQLIKDAAFVMLQLSSPDAVTLEERPLPSAEQHSFQDEWNSPSEAGLATPPAQLPSLLEALSRRQKRFEDEDASHPDASNSQQDLTGKGASPVDLRLSFEGRPPQRGETTGLLGLQEGSESSLPSTSSSPTTGFSSSPVWSASASSPWGSLAEAVEGGFATGSGVSPLSPEAFPQASSLAGGWMSKINSAANGVATGAGGGPFHLDSQLTPKSLSSVSPPSQRHHRINGAFLAGPLSGGGLVLPSLSLEDVGLRGGGRQKAEPQTPPPLSQRNHEAFLPSALFGGSKAKTGFGGGGVAEELLSQPSAPSGAGVSEREPQATVFALRRSVPSVSHPSPSLKAFSFGGPAPQTPPSALPPPIAWLAPRQTTAEAGAATAFSLPTQNPRPSSTGGRFEALPSANASLLFAGGGVSAFPLSEVSSETTPPPASGAPWDASVFDESGSGGGGEKSQSSVEAPPSATPSTAVVSGGPSVEWRGGLFFGKSTPLLQSAAGFGIAPTRLGASSADRTTRGAKKFRPKAKRANASADLEQQEADDGAVEVEVESVGEESAVTRRVVKEAGESRL